MSTKTAITPSLPLGKNVLWSLTLVFAALVLFYTFWAVTASTFEHTRLRPATAPTGSLYSRRFTADFFFTGSLLLLFFIPFSFAWLLGSPSSVARQNTHIMFTALLLIYMIVILLFWGIGFYASANLGTPGNAGNPANDDDWCSVYYTVAGNACGNTAPIMGVTASSLVVNPVFLYKFWFLFVFIIVLIAHFIFVASKFPALQRKNGVAKPQVQPQPEEEQEEEPMEEPQAKQTEFGRFKLKVPNYQGRSAAKK